MNEKTKDKRAGRGARAGVRLPGDAVSRRTGPRVRLEIDERRVQLLEFGKHFFASHAYDDVSIDEVAAAAGVSKGLLFHHFKSKREFYVETIRAMSLQLRRVSAPDPTLPPSARLRAALDAHMKYAKENGAMYVAFCRSGGAIAPEVYRILEEHREQVMGYMLENLGISKSPPLLRTALRTWMVMVQGICLEWIAHPELKHEELRELLIAGYRALLERTLEVEPRSARLAGDMVRRTRHREVKLPLRRARVA
jgi:AcrR family transcriptional regulator